MYKLHFDSSQRVNVFTNGTRSHRSTFPHFHQLDAFFQVRLECKIAWLLPLCARTVCGFLLRSSRVGSSQSYSHYEIASQPQAKAQSCRKAFLSRVATTIRNPRNERFARHSETHLSECYRGMLDTSVALMCPATRQWVWRVEMCGARRVALRT